MDSSLKNAIILLKIIIRVSVHLTRYMNEPARRFQFLGTWTPGCFLFLSKQLFYMADTLGSYRRFAVERERERQADGWVVKCR